MGLSPAQVDEMSAWKFLAARDGYIKAHSSESDELSAKEVDDLWDWIKDG